MLVAAALAVMLPVQQAVIAEVVGDRHLGRGMSWYESAGLIGGLVGSLGAGVLYDVGSWQLACLLAAGVILIGAIAVRAAVATLGVSDRPYEASATGRVDA